MIELIVAGKTLPIQQGETVSLNLVHPAFSGELGYNSHSLEFSVVNTPEARRLLGYADLPNSTQATRYVDGELRLLGVPWRRTRIHVRQAGPERFRVSLALEVGLLSRKLGDTRWPEVDLGGVRQITANVDETGSADMAAHADDAAAGSVDDFDYTFFPVHNPELYYPTFILHPQGYMNFWRGNFNYTEAGMTVNGNKGNILWNLVPFPYLRYLFRQTMAEAGYFLSDQGWFEDLEIQTLCVWNTVTLDDRIYAFLVAMTGPYTAHYFRNWINVADHVPDMTCRQALQGVANLFGLIYIEQTGGVIKVMPLRDLLLVKDTVDWSTRTEVTYSIEWPDEDNGHLFSSTPDPYDALMKAPALEEIKRAITLDGEVDEEADLPTGLTPPANYLVKATNQVFTLNPTGGWVARTYYYFPERIGQGSKQITSAFSTLMPHVGDWATDASDSWRVPVASARGTSPDYYSERLPFAPRLMFYRGIGDYPLGGVDDEGGTYEYSLLWHGERGLYEKWWRTWTEWLAQAPLVQVRVLLTPLDLLGLNWEMPVWLASAEGRVRVLLKEIKLRITADGRLEAEVAGYRL
jgi:hypothetical protein